MEDPEPRSRVRTAALAALLGLALPFAFRQPNPQGTWQLQSVDGDNRIVDDPSQTRPWVRFDGAWFSAHGGCNDFGGEFTAGWTAIKTSDVFSEAGACVGRPRTSQIERAMVQLFVRTDGFTAGVHGDQLTLRGGSTTLVFERLDGR